MNDLDQNIEGSGLLFVVSGPSAVGKDTILNALLESSASDKSLHHPVRRCVTATTRDPRPGEEEGRDYHFLSVQKFHEMAAANGFLEYANVFGNWYGTPRAWVDEQRQAGTDVILKIDVQGARYVHQRVDDAILIFFAPPSLAELERRLRARATESEEQIARRLLDARNELDQITHYHYRVVNNEINDAVADLRSIFRSEHLKINKPTDRAPIPLLK
jgi:guanylate kinase